MLPVDHDSIIGTSSDVRIATRNSKSNIEAEFEYGKLLISIPTCQLESCKRAIA
jgi:hypothetical protein